MNMVEAIKFPVFVDGKLMTASVVEADENPVQYSFTIEFSDGYKDLFTLDEGMIEADKGDMSKSYIKAIRNDIPLVIGLDTNKFYHIFQEPVDGIITNIWIIERGDENNETYYGVYYNEHYRFELRQIKGEWICASRSKVPGAKANEEIAKKVHQILYSLL